MASHAEQTCQRCRTQKRRCDKKLPVCGLCRRLGKQCHYARPAEKPLLLPVPDWADLTPFNLSYTIEAQVSRLIGNGLQLEHAATHYFNTVHTWLPVISMNNYHARLKDFRVWTSSTPPEFSLLTLSMALVSTELAEGQIPLTAKSLYSSLKTFLAFLEGLGGNSLQLVQSRLLLTIFEIGNAIYPAAYISSAATVHASIALGICDTKDDLLRRFRNQIIAEEAWQTWRGIVITHRYASLESGQVPSIPQRRNMHRVGDKPVLGDPTRIKIDSFTKLAYASQLLEQALSHVHLTVNESYEGGAEAVQIGIHLTSFLATFQGDDAPPHPHSDSALAICRSAMLEILGRGIQMKHDDNVTCAPASYRILTSLINEIPIGRYSSPPIETSMFSVFLPFCLYKAAILFLSEITTSKNANPEPPLKGLKDLLEQLSMRWVAARIYLEKIEATQEDRV